LLNGRTYDEMPVAAAVQQSAWRTETTSNDKQRGHPDGALFCLAEFSSLLSLRLLNHSAKIGRGWGPRTSTPPREARVGDPGPPPHRTKRALGTPGLRRVELL